MPLAYDVLSVYNRGSAHFVGKPQEGDLERCNLSAKADSFPEEASECPLHLSAWS